MKFSAPANGVPVYLSQHKGDVVAHVAVHNLEKFPRQIGRAPLARACVLIEPPEGIPMCGLDLISGQRADCTAKGLSLLAFLANVLAFARAERGQKSIKITVALVEPVELLGLAAHEAHLFPRQSLGLGAET